MLSDMFKQALARLVAEKTGDTVTRVTYFDSATRESGGCESCSYSYTVVEIAYDTPERHGRLYEYRGEFAELISDLDRLTPVIAGPDTPDEVSAKRGGVIKQRTTGYYVTTEKGTYTDGDGRMWFSKQIAHEIARETGGWYAQGSRGTIKDVVIEYPE